MSHRVTPDCAATTIGSSSSSSLMMKFSDTELRERAVNKMATGTSIGDESSCNADVDMDSLNAALHELGMLSAITESRREYLRETISRTYSTRSSSTTSSSSSSSLSSSSSNADGFCVLHMNSNYVTDLRLKVTCELGVDADDADQSNSSCASSVATRKWAPPRSRHFQKPYSVPSCAADARLRRRNWARRSPHNNQLLMGDHHHHHGIIGGSESSSKECCMSHVGNRSNPGSPEKGGGKFRAASCCSSTDQYLVTSTLSPCAAVQLQQSLLPATSMSNSGSGLMRSRSLDDIETIQVVTSTPLRSSEEVLQPAGGTRLLDIDNVSARMGHLHVN